MLVEYEGEACNLVSVLIVYFNADNWGVVRYELFLSPFAIWTIVPLHIDEYVVIFIVEAQAFEIDSWVYEHLYWFNWLRGIKQDGSVLIVDWVFCFKHVWLVAIAEHDLDAW